MVVLLAGFSAALSWWHALMLLGLGVAVLGVWRRPVESDVAIPMATAVESRPTGAWQLILSTALGAVGAWLAFKAATVTDQRTRVATGGLIALAVLSPLLALPVIGTTAAASHHGRTNSALAALVGIVLLNLLLLLPMVVLAYYARTLTLAWRAGSRTAESLQDALLPMPFPLAIWRVDTVLLLVLGLMLIPVSLGRWSLRKTEGLLLAMVYATYLIVSTWVAVKI
jgi:Ca2+/Na+ antiporter